MLSVGFHIGSKKVKEGRPESDKYTSWIEAWAVEKQTKLESAHKNKTSHLHSVSASPIVNVSD